MRIMRITTILAPYLVTAVKIPWVREPNSKRLAKSLKTVARARGKYSEFACSEARRPENPVTKAIQTFRITRGSASPAPKATVKRGNLEGKIGKLR
ncbi:hypothetical protein PUN28_000637 [Cardiocondyla obscurior]|uniref:Secreted protein n=1 Tax=Cardiocondyla obscurior TaxID=286306 RepID=A0AAW2H0B6_9HYME